MSPRRCLAPVWVWLTLAAAGVLAGCGDPPRPTVEQLLLKLDDKDPRVADAAAELLGKEGRANPARIVPRIIERLELEHLRTRLLGARVTPDLSEVKDRASREEAMLRLGRFVGSRVGGAGFPGVQVRQEGETTEVYASQPADSALTAPMQAHLLEVLRAPGGFSVRVEVPPPFRATPERPWSPWPGDDADYQAWLVEERARFEAARAGGPAYVPSRPGFRLLAVVAGPEAGAARSVPVLLPEPPLVDLNDDRLATDVGEDRIAGTWSLKLFSVSDGRAETEATLLRLAGLRAWLVIDGEAQLPGSVPTPTARLLMFPVHGTSLEETRARARALQERMASKPFPLRLAVEPLVRPTLVTLDSPAARALAGVGLAAQPAVDALVAKDASWAPFAERMRQALVRTETGLGR